MAEANPTRTETTHWSLRPTTRRDWIELCVILGAVLFPFAVFWLVFGGYRELREWAQRMPFDSHVWTTRLFDENKEPVRIRMVDNLIQKYELRGMTRSEIIDLLSEPPETGYFSEYDFVYWLGPERGFLSIDSEWLAIKFGPDDRVRKFAIVRD